MFYKHVRFSMCPRQDPQRHSEVQGDCGGSPVGVGLQTVYPCHVFWAHCMRQERLELTNTNMTDSVQSITCLSLSGLRFGLGGYRLALTITVIEPLKV